MLKMTVRVGDSVAIGGPTTVTIEHKSGQNQVRLAFDAAKSVPIVRLTNPSRIIGITGKPDPEPRLPA
jgi:sRNA-binding carbon storage regulator CsrA